MDPFSFTSDLCCDSSKQLEMKESNDKVDVDGASTGSKSMNVEERMTVESQKSSSKRRRSNATINTTGTLLFAPLLLTAVVTPVALGFSSSSMITSNTAFRPRLTGSSSVSSSLYMGFKLDLGDDSDEEGKGGGGLTFDENAPRIYFRAKKTHEVQVEMSSEVLSQQRSLLHYLALPAEQYSVLDAGTIQKKADAAPNMFTCKVDPIQFLGSTLEASIDAVVDVSNYPKGKSVIRVINCTLEGSRLAQLANGRFDVDCTNIVRALPSNSEGKSKSRLGRLKDSLMTNGSNDNKDDETQSTSVSSSPLDEETDILSVECQLEISALVPNEGKWLPKRLVGKSGSVVMQSLLSVSVPRFVEQLSKDYVKWSNGDDSRAPVADTKDKQTIIQADNDDNLMEDEVETTMLKQANGSSQKKTATATSKKEHERV